MTDTPPELRDAMFGFGVGVIVGEVGHIFFDNDKYRWAPHHWTLGPPLIVAGGIWQNWFVIGVGAGLIAHDCYDIPRVFETGPKVANEESWVERMIHALLRQGHEKDIREGEPSKSP